VLDVWHDLALGGRIRAELVCDQSPGWAALLLQKASQQALGCRGVAARLHDLVKDVPVLVNRVLSTWREVGATGADMAIRSA
jgi:hypothetical protein